MGTTEETARLVAAALAKCGYGVLATVADGQPHASLMAFAPLAGGRRLLMATYRATRKYRNLATAPRVAVLIDHEQSEWPRAPRHVAVTALGSAHELAGRERADALRSYVACHPDLEAFAASDECALIAVEVDGYHVAGGIDDVGWCDVADLEAS